MSASGASEDVLAKIENLKHELQNLRTEREVIIPRADARNTDKILRDIEIVFENFTKLISRGQALTFRIPRRQSFGENSRELIIRFDRGKSVKKFALICYVLSKIYRLIQTNTTCTKRDLFYQAVDLFKCQSVVDEIVDDIAALFRIPRNFLNILAASKGLVSGNVRFNDVVGNHVDCSLFTRGIQIPADVDNISRILKADLSSDAKFVLVVEKDATFERILQTEFTKKINCILVTGKGFPDMSTRLLLTRLWFDLALPILLLVDADPFGVEIMSVYRFGSLRLAHEVDRLVPPDVVRWLGLLPSDIENLGLEFTPNAILPLTDFDKKKTRQLLGRKNCRKHPEIIYQLEKLLLQNRKSEIQCLDNLGYNFLTDVYLTNKIRLGGWI